MRMQINPKARPYIIPLVVGVILFFAFWVLGGAFLTEETRVRRFILQGKKAAETKNIRACAAMISVDYHDSYGNDRSTLIYTAKEAFKYYQKIFITIHNMDIRLNEKKTEAEVFVVATAVGLTQASRTERVFEGERGRARIRLVKEERAWKLLEVEFYEPITVMGQQIA